MLDLTTTELLDQALTLHFSSAWEQEDINTLHDKICQQLENANIVESILGADRESYRVLWQNVMLVIHFDIYSQSCWIETESANENAWLKTIQTKFQ